MGQPCRKLKIGVSRVGGRGWLQLCSSSFTPSHLRCAGLWGGGGGGGGVYSVWFRNFNAGRIKEAARF